VQSLLFLVLSCDVELLWAAVSLFLDKNSLEAVFYVYSMVDNYAQHASAVFLHICRSLEQLMSGILPATITHTQVRVNQALACSVLFGDNNSSSSSSHYAFQFMMS